MTGNPLLIDRFSNILTKEWTFVIALTLIDHLFPSLRFPLSLLRRSENSHSNRIGRLSVHLLHSWIIPKLFTPHGLYLSGTSLPYRVTIKIMRLAHRYFSLPALEATEERIRDEDHLSHLVMRIAALSASFLFTRFLCPRLFPYRGVKISLDKAQQIFFAGLTLQTLSFILSCFNYSRERDGA